MATSFVKYSQKIRDGPYNGPEYRGSKTLHIVLFDCSSMTPASRSNEIESPILARFKSTAEEALKGSGAEGIKVRFSVIVHILKRLL